MQNGHQILDVITAAFGTQILGADSQVDCTRPETDYQELACQWKDVSGAYAQKTSANDLDPQWVSDMVKVSSPDRIYAQSLTNDSGYEKHKTS
jgi:ethanolaminephosphotransferase